MDLDETFTVSQVFKIVGEIPCRDFKLRTPTLKEWSPNAALLAQSHRQIRSRLLRLLDEHTNAREMLEQGSDSAITGCILNRKDSQERHQIHQLDVRCDKEVESINNLSMAIIHTPYRPLRNNNPPPFIMGGSNINIESGGPPALSQAQLTNRETNAQDRKNYGLWSCAK